MSTQGWAVGLSVYFIFLFVIVSLFSIQGGLFSNNSVIANTNQFNTNEYSYNETSIPDSATGVFTWGKFFKDLFSFFGWNLYYYDSDTPILLEYFWIIRIFLVYLPLLCLIYTLWYSLPTVSS